MKISETDINGVLLIELDVFQDERGLFLESYQKERYFEFGIKDRFEQDNFSISSRNVIRGFHYQKKNPQSQLLTILSGSIFDVLVDLRRSSPSFKKWISVNLIDSSKIRQIYMPPGIAHGFGVLSVNAHLHYKVDKKYIPNNEGGINWADEELNINWPISSPVISSRDLSFPFLKDIPIENLPKNL